ncbi:hypothetical protein N7G274_009313 [Stereocaulon virgatum]|uniref:Wax synthase domain-containing protein n=1 Tax=Stereocaulon virgatum TaxID=373712 RepID=A0ABR3ZXD3_9LECA
MSSLAGFVTNDVIHLPRDALPSRYTHLFFTFLISGLMHVVSDFAQGLSWERSGAIRFFCTQTIGIIGEDAIRTSFRQFLPNMKEGSKPRTLYKFLGYVWVFIFLVWSTPSWIYPSLYENKGEEKDLIVPYSVVGLGKKAGVREKATEVTKLSFESSRQADQTHSFDPLKNQDLQYDSVSGLDLG